MSQNVSHHLISEVNHHSSMQDSVALFSSVVPLYPTLFSKSHFHMQT